MKIKFAKDKTFKNNNGGKHFLSSFIFILAIITWIFNDSPSSSTLLLLGVTFAMGIAVGEGTN